MASKKKDAAPTEEVEVTPPPPAAETTQVPAASEGPAGARHTRGVLAAATAGLLVAGGLAGFGIGRATSDDGGTHFNRIGQMRPGGQGQQGPRGNPNGDQRHGPSQPEDGGPGVPPDRDDMPQAPGADDGSSNSGT